MKKLIILLFILKTSLIFSQSFNDTIINVTGETIIGHVVSVSDYYVIYNIKEETKLNAFSISLNSVKHIVINNNNYPDLTITGKRKSIVSFSGINKPTGNKLIVKQTKLRKNQDKPNSITFIEGDRIVIKRYNNNIIICGKIESISDSSVLVKGNKININEIQRISKRRNGTLLATGLSSVAFLSGIAYVSSATWQPKYDGHEDLINDDTGYLLAILGVAFVDFIITVPAGIIQIATTKYFKMSDGWKLYIVK
ncbi:MAG: hypothetical protein ABR968_09460 [Bacteroidales bacterium]|jgi:hypothetical protein